MMIGTNYTREVSVCKYLDPFNGFQEKKATVEMRRDAITGVVTRILPFRSRAYQRPDIDAYLEKSPPEKCPFCLPQRERLTPRFTADVSPAGQFRRGEAVLFPNAFPHDQFNGVALFSSHHFLGMEDLKPAIMRDAFLICRDYFTRMWELHPDLEYASINWNYMPPAGGGLIHPHLQTVMGRRPTRFVQGLLDSVRGYEETGGHLWAALIAAEKEAGERHIASTGRLEWMVSFAPKGMAGEIDFYLPGRTSIFTVTEAEIDELLQGLTRVFTYLNTSNLISFDLSLYATLREDRRFPIQGRIIPRYMILPLGASDINYFEKLHDEIICPVIPEQLCAELRPYFQTEDPPGNSDRES